MRQADPPASGDDHRGLGQLQPLQAVVVAAHGDDRRDGLEVLEHRGDAQVAGVEDQVAALERLQDAVRQRVEVLADVAVGDDADPARPPRGAHPA